MLLLGFVKLAILCLVLSGFLDTLDGTVARLSGNTSAAGSVLDIVCDRIVESVVILALFAVDPSHRSWLAFFMLMSCYICITSFLVIGIFTKNKSAKEFHYSPGLIERTEAFLFFIAMMWWPDYFGLLSSIFICLVLLTSYLHIKAFIIAPKRTVFSSGVTDRKSV